ncbi:MAG: ABC transporter permease [Caldilineae bacterium]|nr:MAG: ABC transporter permease [Caldilineae bacterium]
MSQTPLAIDRDIFHEEERSRIRRLWGAIRLVRRSNAAMAGTAIILIWLLIAILAPYITPYDHLAQDLSHRLEPPNRVHWFGSDELGRDIFSRVLYGARISMPLGILVVALSSVIGILVGGISGYVGGTFDEVVMRIADVFLAFPSLVLAMAITAALGPGLNNAMLAIVVVLWPTYARVIRGQVLAVKERDYIEAARAVGAPSHRILLRHVFPNSYTPVFVKASLDIGAAILIAAGLSFIGLGAPPPTPEWGTMVSMGRQKFAQWWIATFPGLAMLTVVMGFNFLGDGLRDLLDPYIRRGSG